MALYPFTVATSIPAGLQPLAPGTAICIPITLAAGGQLDLDLVQATGEAVQDFTLRAWVSVQPLGNPDPSLPPCLQSWQPNKSPGTIVVSIFDRQVSAPSKVYALPADSGNYFLNVLNLTNQPNQFWLTVSDGAASTDADDTLVQPVFVQLPGD